MRIAFVIWNYWPDRQGGSERQCRLMARLLVDRGHVCEVFAAFNQQEYSSHDFDGSVRVHRIGRFSWRLLAVQRYMDRLLYPFRSIVNRLGWDGGRKCVEALSFWICLPAVNRARRSFVRDLDSRFTTDHAFDVIHLHEPSWLSGPAAIIGARWRIPVLAQEATHETLLPLPLDVPDRKTFDKARRDTFFIAMAPFLRDDLEGKGVPSWRIFDLPNGVVLPQEASLGGRGVLYVGNFSQGAHWKAFDILFGAWERVVRHAGSSLLTLVGGGDSRIWREQAKFCGFFESLAFVGQTNDPGVFFREADIFVLPSRVEGMSNALLEAQSWGIACVVSNIPGNRTIVEHEVNGLVVPVGDDEALAEALIRLLLDPCLRRRLGENARRRMIEQYEAGGVATRLEAIYQRLKISSL